MPRRMNETGMRIFDGILSPSCPMIGSKIIVPIVDVRMIHWYKSFESSSLIRPSSTKLVIQRSKKFENKIAIKRMMAPPKKQTIYLESLPHSAHMRFVRFPILAQPFSSTEASGKASIVDGYSAASPSILGANYCALLML